VKLEGGAGTLLAAGLGVVLMLLVGSGLLLAQASVAAARAATAADLAALAGADAARGLRDGDPCSLAAETASRQQARLLSCDRSGESGTVVEVRTAVSVPGTCTRRHRPRQGRPAAVTGRCCGCFCHSPSGACDRSRPRRRAAPSLLSGLLRLPHLGDWTQDGQPVSHSQEVIASRVARCQTPAAS
jgi:secretion/DNA translocation related TadE-like protein